MRTVRNAVFCSAGITIRIFRETVRNSVHGRLSSAVFMLRTTGSNIRQQFPGFDLNRGNKKGYQREIMGSITDGITAGIRDFQAWKQQDRCVVFPIITDLHSNWTESDPRNSQKRITVKHLELLFQAA